MSRNQVMLKFFFWLIIGLLFFIPACSLTSKYFKLNVNGLSSYNKLIELVESVKDGEILSLPYYMDKKTALIGFSNDSNRFECNNCEFTLERTSVFNKPTSTTCEDDSSCICLCTEGFKYGEGTQSRYQFSCEKMYCSSFQSLKFLDKVDVKSSNLRAYWECGFLYGRTIHKIANGLLPNNIATRTFYVQRYKNTVHVCTESPCITDKIKEQIDSKDKK